jgi:DsbC/DsbD-like thiol-disulfide interchange protein
MMAMVTLRSDAYSSRFVAHALVLATALATPLTSQATEIASAWSEGKTETKARLIAGTAASKTVAAVEIQLADGWKTYWRFPGDGGGVPPMFDWGKSDNVASVRVLYPQPKRFADTAGDTLGYKGLAVFPLIVEPKDATKPVTLKLSLDYGICREVCVPVEAALAVDIPVSGTTEMPAHVLAAIDHVPRTGQELRANDPRVIKVEVKLDGAAPSLAIEADYPGGIANADAYIESPEGFYIPLPKVGSAKEVGQNRLRFEIDLTGAVDPADIKGKDAKVTLVSDKGLSETTFKLE